MIATTTSAATERTESRDAALSPARGILFGCALSAALWLLVLGLAMADTRYAAMDLDQQESFSAAPRAR